MTRRITPRPPRKTIVCIGDSLTFARSNCIRPEQYFPEQLAALLRNLGCNVRAFNFGVSGDTSGPSAGNPGLTTRTPLLFPSYVPPTAAPGPPFPALVPAAAVTGLSLYPVPDLAVIYAGTNDYSNTLTPSFTAKQGPAGNVNVGAHDWAVSFVNNGVESPASIHLPFTVAASASHVYLNNLPIGSAGTTARKIYRSLSGVSSPSAALGLVGTLADNSSLTFDDNLADAGLGAAPPSSIAQLSASAVNPIATTHNLQSVIAQLLSAGCPRIIYVSREHYLNYSAGGDTQSTQQTAAAAVRGATSATNSQPNPQLTAFGGTIFDPQKVVGCDLFTAFSNLIANSARVTFSGVTYSFTQGADCVPAASGFNWHVADANIHLNALGEFIVAQTLLATLQAQTSQTFGSPKTWVDDLK